jgi:hypothetical protein
MAEGFVHTVHKGGQWVNEIENRAQVGGAHSSKDEAVAAGRARAQQDGTEYVIHNEDGRIGERIVRRRSVVPPQADRPDVNLPSSMSARNAVCVFSSSLL